MADNSTNQHPKDPGLFCVACGKEMTYKGRGRRPQYCSDACRHRGWARREAAKEGTIASQVVELPALATTSYERGSVARWLARDPDRVVDVAAIMAKTRTLGKYGTIDALGKALDRLRWIDGRTKPGTKLEKDCLRENGALKAELEQLRQSSTSNTSALSETTPSVEPPPPGPAEELERSKHREDELQADNTRLRKQLAQVRALLNPDPTASSPTDAGDQKPEGTSQKPASSTGGSSGTPAELFPYPVAEQLNSSHNSDAPQTPSEPPENEDAGDDRQIEWVEYYHPFGTFIVDASWTEEECEKYAFEHPDMGLD